VGKPLDFTFPAASGCFFELFEETGVGTFEAGSGVDVGAGELALFAGVFVDAVGALVPSAINTST
jgi:hypothetical protein